MSRSHPRRFAIVCALLLGVGPPSLAPLAAQQPRAVEGRVVEAGTRRPLEGATVSVLNTARAAITGADGSYRLEVLPGRYTVSAMRIGYARRALPVTIVASGTTLLDIELSATSVKLSDVVVTAEKQEQRVQEIPYAISAISTEQIRNAKIEKPSDLTGFVPNLVQNSAGTTGVNLLSIRGINSYTGGSYENSIATYVDGIYLFDVAALDTHLGDIERVEVLRGPQGTLYGRGASGGVINVVIRLRPISGERSARSSSGTTDSSATRARCPDRWSATVCSLRSTGSISGAAVSIPIP